MLLPPASPFSRHPARRTGPEALRTVPEGPRRTGLTGADGHRVRTHGGAGSRAMRKPAPPGRWPGLSVRIGPERKARPDPDERPYGLTQPIEPTGKLLPVEVAVNPKVTLPSGGMVRL